MNEILFTAAMFTSLLGHDEFAVRDRANKALQEVELSPKVRLVKEILIKAKDPEIVWRVRQLCPHYDYARDIYGSGLETPVFKDIVIRVVNQHLTMFFDLDTYDNIESWITYDNKEIIWEEITNEYITHVLINNNYDPIATKKQLLQEIIEAKKRKAEQQ